MQIFLSHSGKQKPLVREIKKNLPEHLGLWIDEEQLQFGDSVAKSIKTTIEEETDYVILFLDESAVDSEWVKKEIEWTLEAEREHQRTILLPILLDEQATHVLERDNIRDRKYLKLAGYQESAVSELSNLITSELFALVCRDLSQIRSPDQKVTPISTIKDGDVYVKEQAKLVQKAIFPHRSSNPITLDKLWSVLSTARPDLFNREDLGNSMGYILERNLVPGLVFDGYEAYLNEEHARWKCEISRDKKQSIAREACKYIKNGMSVFLDAGSTVEEIVQIINQKIRSRAITSLTIATTSINIADMFSDCSVEMGFDDNFKAITLCVPGGMVRPATQAIVPIHDDSSSHIGEISKLVGGFDVCFVGANGIDEDVGLTTCNDSEAGNKLNILAESKCKYAVGDSSKIGIKLERVVATLDKDVKLIIDNDPDNEALKSIINRYGKNIILS